MRTLVCGGRYFQDFRAVYAALDALTPEVTLIIEGGAKGVDRAARYWAMDRKIPVHTFQADWKGLGRIAGVLRNQRMLDEGQPDRVVAFPGGAGTADMIRRSRKAGLLVVVPVLKGTNGPSY